VRWRLAQRGGQWTLGTILVHDKPVDDPLASGILALRSTGDGRTVWPPAVEGKQVGRKPAG